MTKPVISPEEFVAEVNRRLSSQHSYKTGMQVFLVPRGSNGRTASGYDWEPKDMVTTGVVADFAAKLEAEFEVNPHISRVPRD